MLACGRVVLPNYIDLGASARPAKLGTMRILGLIEAGHLARWANGVIALHPFSRRIFKNFEKTNREMIKRVSLKG
jgi:hypothetical protein